MKRFLIKLLGMHGRRHIIRESVKLQELLVEGV